MTEREALALVRQLLTDVLAERPASQRFVRDVAGRVGELQGSIRAALTVIDQVIGDAS